MPTSSFTHSGGIVIRRAAGAEPLVLVVRPSKGGEAEWVLPKGHIEEGETVEEAGVREVGEEAQVKGLRPRYVGSTSYKVPHEDVVCAFYLMDDGGPVASDEEREIAWLSLRDLGGSMPYPDSIALIEKALGMLDGTTE